LPKYGRNARFFDKNKRFYFGQVGTFSWRICSKFNGRGVSNSGAGKQLKKSGKRKRPFSAAIRKSFE
jgi:hypothetical protein